MLCFIAAKIKKTTIKLIIIKHFFSSIYFLNHLKAFLPFKSLTFLIICEISLYFYIRLFKSIILNFIWNSIQSLIFFLLSDLWILFFNIILYISKFEFIILFWNWKRFQICHKLFHPSICSSEFQNYSFKIKLEFRPRTCMWESKKKKLFIFFYL